jgi:hypothetical protein
MSEERPGISERATRAAEEWRESSSGGQKESLKDPAAASCSLEGGGDVCEQEPGAREQGHAKFPEETGPSGWLQCEMPDCACVQIEGKVLP